MKELGELSLGRSLLLQLDGQSPRLAASRCPSCGDVRIPQREVCCNHQVTCEPIQLSGLGTIYEAVHISLPPSGFDEPFWAGFIDLEEGPRFFAQIGCEPGEGNPEHGEVVEMFVEPIGSAESQILAPVFRRVGSHAAL
ncbi:hypothetical protein CJ179_01215 [Rhodococcus sp. ACS1]|uniref:Zn-ribbon domain-containing OB-fold protein n=1 Tax=Rhodococcus sp. ACS1 TaxID=2028570 RepID=UPI000BB1049C|nr:OB-fold domain-containing protein [Rhodococcus sp. ACS1]PBC52052.1 hypothetical protein CJ179_01215 [Rhodococcus sp. ACS1]